jgi:hypothetical protein
MAALQTVVDMLHFCLYCGLMATFLSNTEENNLTETHPEVFKIVRCQSGLIDRSDKFGGCFFEMAAEGF